MRSLWFWMGLLGLVYSGWAAAITFNPTVSYATGSDISKMAAGDFTGDGKPDLILTRNLVNSNLSLLVANGNSFNAPLIINTGLNDLSEVVAGDFTGDGKQDVLALASGGGAIYVIPGNGDGTFGTPIVTTPPGVAEYLRAKDVGGDGKLDIFYGEDSSNKLYLMRGNGDGTFQTQEVLINAADSSRYQIQFADVNHDGKIDLVVHYRYSFETDTYRVAVLLGNGDHTFGAANDVFDNDTASFNLMIGDFNGDTHLDLLMADWDSGDLKLLPGLGDGSFGAMTTIANEVTYAAITADIDADNKPDLLYLTAGLLNLRYNNGGASFSAATTQTIGNNFDGMLAFDFNTDGAIDFAILRPGDEFVDIIRGSGGGGASPFAFTTVNNAALSALYTSNSITVAGLAAAGAISITGGQYRINGGIFTTVAGTVNNGDVVEVRVQASPNYAIPVVATLTIQGTTGNFTVITGTATPQTDTDPDPFSFSPLTDALPGAVLESEWITVSGINTATTIRVAGGEFSINGTAYTSGSDQVVNGQKVRVRLTAPARFDDSASAVLTIGGRSAVFTVTTRSGGTTNLPPTVNLDIVVPDELTVVDETLNAGALGKAVLPCRNVLVPSGAIVQIGDGLFSALAQSEMVAQLVEIAPGRTLFALAEGGLTLSTQKAGLDLFAVNGCGKEITGWFRAGVNYQQGIQVFMRRRDDGGLSVYVLRGDLYFQQAGPHPALGLDLPTAHHVLAGETIEFDALGYATQHRLGSLDGWDRPVILQGTAPTPGGTYWWTKPYVPPSRQVGEQNSVIDSSAPLTFTTVVPFLAGNNDRSLNFSGMLGASTYEAAFASRLIAAAAGSDSNLSWVRNTSAFGAKQPYGITLASPQNEVALIPVGPLRVHSSSGSGVPNRYGLAVVSAEPPIPYWMWQDFIGVVRTYTPTVFAAFAPTLPDLEGFARAVRDELDPRGSVSVMSEGVLALDLPGKGQKLAMRPMLFDNLTLPGPCVDLGKSFRTCNGIWQTLNGRGWKTLYPMAIDFTGVEDLLRLQSATLSNSDLGRLFVVYQGQSAYTLQPRYEFSHAPGAPADFGQTGNTVWLRTGNGYLQSFEVK